MRGLCQRKLCCPESLQLCFSLAVLLLEKEFSGDSFSTEVIVECGEVASWLVDGALRAAASQQTFGSFGYRVAVLWFLECCGKCCLLAG